MYLLLKVPFPNTKCCLRHCSSCPIWGCGALDLKPSDNAKILPWIIEFLYIYLVDTKRDLIEEEDLFFFLVGRSYWWKKIYKFLMIFLIFINLFSFYKVDNFICLGTMSFDSSNTCNNFFFLTNVICISF